MAVDDQSVMTPREATLDAMRREMLKLGNKMMRLNAEYDKRVAVLVEQYAKDDPVAQQIKINNDVLLAGIVGAARTNATLATGYAAIITAEQTFF